MGAKAVVLEVDGDSAVVLREGGEFLRVPLCGRRWQVGQEIVLDPVPTRRSPWRLLIAWSAAAALLVAVFSSFLVTPAAAQPAGYVTVDLDPARVGLVTDAWAVVLGVEPLTQEALALVEPMAWAGLPVDRAIVALIERALGRPGMLPGVVVIAAAPLEEGRGLPPAVRQAVGRAQWGTARVLGRGPEPVAAAVIALEDPEVGVRLAQLAQRTGMSLFQIAALVGARLQEIGGVEPGGAGPEAVRRVLADLADLPPEQVRRAWSASRGEGAPAGGTATAGGAAVARPPGSSRAMGDGWQASASGRGAASGSAGEGRAPGPAAAGPGATGLPSPVIGLRLVDLLGEQIDGIVRGLLLLRPGPAGDEPPAHPTTNAQGGGRGGGADRGRRPGAVAGRLDPEERERDASDGGERGAGRGRSGEHRSQGLAKDRSPRGAVHP
ncbi:MAG TPA: anti-sigma factor domain-containing protein, partial [Thermaerobacter sp.]